VLIALAVGVLLWLALERTRTGAMIRAAVDDPEMAGGVGINVPLISMAVFALGACLAAVAGVIEGAFLGVFPGADFEVLPYAFVVVIVGGLGSLPARWSEACSSASSTPSARPSFPSCPTSRSLRPWP